MRLSIELNTVGRMASGRSGPDPASPNLSYLGEEAALKSFFATVDRIVADNPVACRGCRSWPSRRARRPSARRKPRSYRR